MTKSVFYPCADANGIGRGHLTRRRRRMTGPSPYASVPLVRAEGKVIHVGKQVATAEGFMAVVEGKIDAHATTTCLIF